MSTTIPEPSGERRLDLDWVRITAFGLLILYHCAMFYVPWDWHVKSPHVLPWLQPVMVLTNPWRLPLLFLVSGAATRFMADKMSAGALFGKRMWRLFPPLVFGMLVIVPPQTWMQVTHSFHQPIGPLAFYERYVTASGHWCASPGNGCLITPTWNHLWFVAYLVVYTAILCGVLAVARTGVGRMQAGAERLFANPWALVLIPLAGALASRMILGPRFPDTHALMGDWTVHAESALPFAFGYLFAKAPGVWAAMRQARWPALALAGVGFAAYATFQAVWWDYRNIPHPALLLSGVGYPLEQWGGVVAILGFAHRWLKDAKDTAARRYLTDAIFPFYIIHQTIIVLAAPWLASLGLPQGLEAAILVAITAAGCFATYEAVRRVAPLRPLFGLTLRPKGGPAPTASGGRGRLFGAARGVGLGPAGQDAI